MVAVRGRDARGGEHPPEPGCRLGDHRARAQAGALEGGRRAARPAAHDEDLGVEHGLGADLAGDRSQEEQDDDESQPVHWHLR